MSRKSLLFVCMVLPLLIFLWGCPVKSQLIAYCEDEALDEDRYAIWKNIAIDKTGRVYSYINLTHWDGHYELEILLMTMDGFTAYDNGNNFNAWHTSVYTKCRQSFEFPNVPPGNYAVVVDNTDSGWKSTNFDFENDYAVFDLKVYHESY